MENVVRIKYLEELNQLWLIGSNELRSWLKGHERPTANSIMKKVARYIARVDSASESGIVLGSCFTNLNRFYTRNCGANLLVFPIHNEAISYTFRNDVDYLITNKGDPTILCPKEGICINQNDAILFFGENLFENNDKYQKIKNELLQSRGDMWRYPFGRNKLVRRAGWVGIGSLDPFVEEV